MIDELKARGFAVESRRYWMYGVLPITEDLQLDLRSKEGSPLTEVMISNGGAWVRSVQIVDELTEDKLLPLLDGLIIALAPLKSAVNAPS